MIEDFQDMNGKHPQFVNHLNDVVEVVNRVGGMEASWPLMIDRMQGYRVSLALEIPQFARMRVKEEFNNYLRCRLWNGTADGVDEIYVAKPWKLRHVLGNYPNLTGLTTVAVNEVEATDGVDTETWLVTPDYDVNDEIYALYVGTTGVTGPSGITDLGWLEVSFGDPRGWAVEAE